MDSLSQIKKEFAEICDQADSKLGELINKCIAAQIDLDKWCKNKTFLIYSLAAIAKVIYQNQEMILGVGDWLNARAIEVTELNDVPFMNDESDLEFLRIIVRMIGEKIQEIGPICFAGLVYIGQILTLFVCDKD